MLKTKTTVQEKPWTLNLRTRIGDAVTHDSNTWVNITGKNSEPGVGTDWEPLQGTGSVGGDISAPSFLVYGTSLGKYNDGDTVPAFPTIQEQIRDLGQQVTQPSWVNPTGGISSNVTPSLLYEIGQVLTMNLTTSYTANDGGAVTSQTIEKDDTSIGTSSPLNNYALTVSAITQKIDATLNYAAGTGTKDTTPPTTPVPNPIGASSIDTNDLNYRGIHPVFIVVTDTDPTVNQALLDTATQVQNGNFQISSTGTVTVNFATGPNPKYLTIFYPASSTTKTTWFVTSLNNGAIGGGSNLFGDVINLNVNSPLTRWTNVAYKAHKTNFATISNDNKEFRN